MNAETSGPLLLSSPSSAANSDAFNRRMYARPRRSDQVWTRLFWKEWRCSAMVLWVMLILIVVGFGWTAIMEAITDRDHSYGYFMTWVLAPFLAALGLPARLMGMENEDRTFDWLRTLPVSSTVVMTVKLLVAFLIWGLVLVSVSLLAWISLEAQLGHSMRIEGITIAGITVFSFALLIVGMISCLLVRTTVYALLLTIPLLLLVLFAFQVLGALLVGTTQLGFLRVLRGSEGPLIVATLIAGFASLVALIYWLGHRRLTGASEERPVARALEPSPYQSPSYYPTGRVSAWRSLLWQQRKQTSLGVGLCMLVAGFCLLIAFFSRMAGAWDAEPVTFVVSCLVLCYLGVLSFHNDSKKEQIGFLAHHGLLSMTIWWTRLLPTLIPAAVLGGLWIILIFQSSVPGEPVLAPGQMAFWILTPMCAAYFLGVACVQCCHRPSLAFFLAPILTIGWLLPFSSLMATYYWAYLGLVVIAVSVLVFATYRITRFWMNGTHEGVLWRVVAYAMLAWLLVAGGLFTHRYATMPTDRIAELESEIVLLDREFIQPVQDTIPREPVELMVPVRDPASFGFASYSGNAVNWRDEDPSSIEVNDLLDVLHAELDDSTRIGAFISPGMLRNLIHSDPTWLYTLPSYTEVDVKAFRDRDDEIQSLAIEVALHWCTHLREDIVNRHDSRDTSWQAKTLFGFVESLEGVVTDTISAAIERQEALERFDEPSTADADDATESYELLLDSEAGLDANSMLAMGPGMTGAGIMGTGMSQEPGLTVPDAKPLSRDQALKLVEAFPSNDVRKASRLVALIAHWREYTENQMIFGRVGREPAMSLWIEQERQEREVAIATLYHLQKIAERSAGWQVTESETLKSLWIEAINYDGSGSVANSLVLPNRPINMSELQRLDARYLWIDGLSFPSDELLQQLRDAASQRE